MLSTSKDILNIVIAFCVLWFTIFLCWMIFYMAMILKRVNLVMNMFTETLAAVKSFFEKAKEKVNNFGTILTTAMEVGKKVADYVQEKKVKKTANRKVKVEEK